MSDHMLGWRGFSNRHLVWVGSFAFLLPNLLFASYLAPLPAIALWIGSAGFVVFVLTHPFAAGDGVLTHQIDFIRLAGCLAIAIALLVIGGEHHFMFANWDWLWRDAVLADLAKAPGLPQYQVDGEAFFLRAPLGMYMLPAFVARSTSLGLGHAVLLAQNAALLALSLYMIVALAGRHAIWIIGSFLTFSGMDLIGEGLAWLSLGKPLASFTLPSHIESWTRFQYSSVLTQLFWVPNHALPSYWLTVLVLLCARRQISTATLALNFAACLFWSPFAFIGAAPFALYLCLRDGRAALRDPKTWIALAVCLCFLPIARYLSVDAAHVPHEFLLLDPSILLLIAVFLAVEIPHAAVCLLVRARYDVEDRRILAVAICTLVALPTMRLGLANDLVMRASIPALMILAIAFGDALRIAALERRLVLLGTGVAIALVGLVTPLQEVRRAFAFSHFAISDCNLLTVWKKLSPQQPALENYLARRSAATGLLDDMQGGGLFVEQRDRVCWPDLPYDPHTRITLLSNAMIKAERKGPPF